MMTGQRNRRRAGLLLVLTAGAALAGCNSTEPNAPPTPVVSSSSGAVSAACTDAAELKSSAQSLTEVEPLHDGLDALKAASAATRADLETAVASATKQLEPAVEQVTTSFSDLQTAMSGLTTDNVREKAPEIATALRGLDTALGSLGDVIAQECPDS